MGISPGNFYSDEEEFKEHKGVGGSQSSRAVTSFDFRNRNEIFFQYLKIAIYLYQSYLIECMGTVA